MKRPSLQPLFDELNDQHFNGALQRYRVRRWPATDDFNKLRKAGVTNHALKLIRIQSSATGDHLRRTMLHEMCHVACPDGHRMHGACFLACLRRLAQTEPLLTSELLDYDESLPVPLHMPGVPRAAVLSWAVADLARSGRPWRWSAVRRLLAEKLDLYETGFDEEFPDARAEWTGAVARDRAIRSSTLGGVIGNSSVQGAGPRKRRTDDGTMG